MEFAHCNPDGQGIGDEHWKAHNKFRYNRYNGTSEAAIVHLAGLMYGPREGQDLENQLFFTYVNTLD